MSLVSFFTSPNNTAWIPVQFGNVVTERSKTNNFTIHILTVVTLFLVVANIRGVKLSSLFFRRKSIIDQIPGPRALPFLGNFLEIVFVKDLLGRLLSLAREYKHYYRLKIGFSSAIVLTSPESIEKLLSSSEDGHLTKSDEYTALADFFDDGLVTSAGEKWRHRRKLFSSLFNYKCFPHFLEVFNRHSKHLIRDLDKLYPDDKPRPIQNAIYESLLKIICETSMGVELNDTPDGFDKFFEEAERSKEYIWFKVSRPWYQIKWIWMIHPFRRVYEENMRYIKDYISQVIREARAKFVESQESEIESTKNKTVMDAMLEKGLSDSDIREEAHTIISAGHETSGAALQFTLMFLALYPEHQRKCQEEVDQIINDESKCPDANFTMSSLADLKHTERCIKEALRIYPIAYMTARKIQTPLEMGDNVVFPAGTTFVMFATDLHRNPDIFPEPEKFDPSRFAPENCSTRHPYAYIPFSGGPRLCLGGGGVLCFSLLGNPIKWLWGTRFLGLKFAMAQMKLVTARILHHFTISTIDQLEDVPLDTSIVLTPVRGYNFVLKRRNPIST